MAKNMKTISLMVKCRDLLESGLTYQQIRYMLSYDKDIFLNKAAANRLIENDSHLSEGAAIELYQTTQTPNIITSLKEYGSYKEALDLAQESLEYEENEAAKLTLKNTNLG